VTLLCGKEQRFCFLKVKIIYANPNQAYAGEAPKDFRQQIILCNSSIGFIPAEQILGA